MTGQMLEVLALRIEQSPGRFMYSFAVDGKDLPKFTTVSRIHRDLDDGALAGYQRPEVLSHVSAIRAYVESASPLIPNPIVIAFDTRVTFEPVERDPAMPPYVTMGSLLIPVDPDVADEDKPGWIVDGQQRSAAVRDAQVDAFPLGVSAFITSSESEQRSQFILVNSTKPLPKGLIYELLPTTEGVLPDALARKKFPSLLLERLNLDEESPFSQRIQTPTNPAGIVKDNSILRMLENSLTDGALYHYRDPATGTGDVEAMVKVLFSFWKAVEIVFPSAWKLPPTKSRLTHGVGIASVGFLMDAIVETYIGEGFEVTVEYCIEELEPLRDHCHWTGGEWVFSDGSQRRWNDLQNTPRDIRLLTEHLDWLYNGRK
jgi:DGQHR domain-containing protein